MNPNLSRLPAITAAGGGSNGTLGRIQKGDTGVSIDVLAPPAKAFGVEPWQLLSEDLGKQLKEQQHATIEHQLLLQEQRANYSVNVELMPLRESIKSLAFHLRNLDTRSMQRASVLLGELPFDPEGYASIATLLQRVIDQAATAAIDDDDAQQHTERPRNRS